MSRVRHPPPPPLDPTERETHTDTMVDQNDTQMVGGERERGRERGRKGRWIGGVQTHRGMSSRWASACISGGNIGQNGWKRLPVVGWGMESASDRCLGGQHAQCYIMAGHSVLNVSRAEKGH